MAAFFEQVEGELGPVDILVNNAGITRDTHVALMDAGRWDEVMRVNLDAAYSCVRAVVRGMLLRAGAASSTCHRRVPGCRCPGRPYAASKAGLEGFTRALSRDWRQGRAGERGAPGLIDTDMMQAIPAAARRRPTWPRCRSAGLGTMREVASARRLPRVRRRRATSPGRSSGWTAACVTGGCATRTETD